MHTSLCTCICVGISLEAFIGNNGNFRNFNRGVSSLGLTLKNYRFFVTEYHIFQTVYHIYIISI